MILADLHGSFGYVFNDYSDLALTPTCFNKLVTSAPTQCHLRRYMPRFPQLDCHYSYDN